MKPSLQWLRYAVRVVILLALVAVPVLAVYRQYLANDNLEYALETWSTCPQKMGLQLAHITIAADTSKAGSAKAAEKLMDIRGNTWSGVFWGLPFTDPLAVLETITSSKVINRVILTAVFLPLLLTLIFGRVFCSWICPAGLMFEVAGKLRNVLKRAGRLGDRHFWRGNKYVLLVSGLCLSAVLGMPLLSSFYPPALLVTDLGSEIDFLYGRAATGIFGFSLLGLSVGSLFLFGLVSIEWFISKRAWCRYLCPGGALYSILGARRLWRVRRETISCTNCGDCSVACPMGLNPMKDSTGLECDNCLACVSSCPEKGALGVHFSQKNKAIADTIFV